MLKRLSLAAIVLAILAFGVPTFADVPATLILKSGEKLSGDLVDMGADFTFKVNGQARHYPISDVAVIDFTGAGTNLPDSELSKVQPGQGLVVLRNGQNFTGKLYDISGTSPLKLTFDTSNGQRQLSSTEVQRIYLERPNAAVATSGTPAQAPSVAGNNIIVPGNANWVPTGITVRRGQMVSFSVTGQVQLSNDPNDIATAAGSKTGRYAPRAPMPRALAGALIGRIGNSAPFGIGDQTSVPMPASGQLYLRINDDNINDNSGQFNVVINLQ